MSITLARAEHLNHFAPLDNGANFPQRPAIGERDSLTPSPGQPGSGKRRVLAWVAGATLAAAGASAVVPVDVTIAGEAEVSGSTRQTVYCQADGTVARVLVACGSEVRQGQTIAIVDSKELDHKIAGLENDVQMAEADLELNVRLIAIGQTAKAQNRSQLELKHRQLKANLAYWKAQRQNLEVKAPISGRICTPGVQGLAGTTLVSGGAFCEVVANAGPALVIQFPAEQASHIKIGQRVSVYLDANPLDEYEVAVQKIAPTSENLGQRGKFVQVEATFVSSPAPVGEGMKGIGRIQLGETNLFCAMRNRMLRAWRRWSLS